MTDGAPFNSAASPSHRLSPHATSQGASSRNFREKDSDVQELINEALDILDAFGIPMTATGRRRECMAMAFIAVAGVTPGQPWSSTEDFEQERSLKSRDIINFRNEHLMEVGSSGSYDDVRRRDLKPLVAAGIMVNSLPGSAHNAPNRGYALHPEFAHAVRAFGTDAWEDALASVMANYETLREQLSAEREMQRVPIELASGVELDFGPGAHNELQRAIVEEFLPRYGYGAEVLYIGDAEDKDAHYDEDRLKELGFFALDHEELPDVVAFSTEKNWLYVVEAVASSGPVDAYRHAALRRLLAEVTCDGVVYVTAFPDRGKVFKQYLPEISWETEVWVATEPDHVIHFDGERFLGPYDLPESPTA
jgi:type II restriction enzyme